MSRRLVVIGGVAAGMSAAAKARRTDRDLEVVVYQKDAHISYAACGLPYFIAGDVPSLNDLIVRTPKQMVKQGVDVRTHHQVTAISPQTQTVAVLDLQSDREFVVDFDRLVIATGARPAWPSLPGTSLEGVYGMRSLESGRAIQGFLSKQERQKALIIGGGFVGIEMAEAFRRLGLAVTMIIRSGKVLRATLDDDMRELVHAALARHGVEVIQDTPTAFEGVRRLETVVTAAGRHSCDLALLGMGARPNTDLARTAGVTLGTTGAIATDTAMRTNFPAIYAAGDCAEALHLVTQQPVYIPLGSTANKQGRIAGENAAGGRATFGGVTGTTVVRCFDVAVASTGLSTPQAQQAGFSVTSTKIQAKDISHYFPGAADIHVKLIVDAESDRLLGGQIVGTPSVAKRIDVLATALYNRMTIAELRRLDLSYAPPFAPVWDPILVAANVAAK